MQRQMSGFHRDAEGHWVAELSCGHTQHVRHQPPFTLRPWVLTEEGRQGRIGQELECPACDRRQMPDGYAPYRRTPTFRRENVPQGLLRRHTTKRGIWAQLVVLQGSLEFFETCAQTEQREPLSAGQRGVIRPEVEHRVALGPDAEFYVEFWGPAGEGRAGEPVGDE
jgi:tellurite methyltransferase